MSDVVEYLVDTDSSVAQVVCEEVDCVFVACLAHRRRCFAGLGMAK